MSNLLDLIRRLVTVENDQLPYDYEQGLCAWCRKGFTGPSPDRPRRYPGPTTPPAMPHADDCPYIEALALLPVSERETGR